MRECVVRRNITSYIIYVYIYIYIPIKMPAHIKRRVTAVCCAYSRDLCRVCVSVCVCANVYKHVCVCVCGSECLRAHTVPRKYRQTHPSVQYYNAHINRKWVISGGWCAHRVGSACQREPEPPPINGETCKLRCAGVRDVCVCVCVHV